MHIVCLLRYMHTARHTKVIIIYQSGKEIDEIFRLAKLIKRMMCVVR